MANDNELMKATKEFDETDTLDFDKLEEKLQSQLNEELADLDFLKEEKDKIGNPDNLGDIIKDVIWEQFINQIATTAGEDFIRENRGLTLDLRKDAHIQTTENFKDGKIATHNTEIDYQKRYDDWNDLKNSEEPRKPFDKNRPKGTKTVHKDHDIPVAEMLNDAAANAHLTQEELVAFANGPTNLHDLDASANNSKRDKPMNEWLDSERNGEKPADRFNINEDELREQDRVAREEFEKLKAEGEKRSIEAGKKSQRAEAKRIGGKAVRAVVMRLLAEFVKEIISKLVKWFKSADKKLESFLGSLKEAITTFVGKLKTHLIGAADTLVTTIATAIFGPVISTIKKVWTLLKQGWKSLKEAIAYIKNPKNKGKPIGILLMEVGKIVMAALSSIGAIVLGEAIEKALIAIPGAGAFFAFDIPLLGSLANILGIFFGALVAGIIGAIAINLLDKAIAKQKKMENDKARIDKGNEILATQHKLQIVNESLLKRDKENAQSNISERHQEAVSIMKNAYGNIMEDFVEDFSENEYSPIIDEEDVIINNEIDKTSNDLDDLLDWLK